MNSTRSIVVAALALAVVCVAVRVLFPARPQAIPKPAAEPRGAGADPARRPARSVEPPVAPPASRPRPVRDEYVMSPAGTAPEGKPQPQTETGTRKTAQAGTSTKASASAPAKTPTTAGTQPGARRGKPPIQDHMARAALAFVGADPDAEMYWYSAINDPSLGPQERQDLIEDLNEDGLSDPHHPTLADLPLILNRIALIEAVVWDAMDEVNTDAFLEAYKDLVNLAFQAMENG